MPPASPIGCNHTCPMVTALVPHVGGPISVGFPGLLIGGIAAGFVGASATCTGPTDTISTGFPGLLVGGPAVAFVGSGTAHGGTVVVGNPLVMVG